MSAHLRSSKRSISDAWESRVRAELPALAVLGRSALVDHLPEFLDGLAEWVEGEVSNARRSFEALVEGHAVQRLQYNVDLATLTREYALLRTTIIRELLAVPSSEHIRESMVNVNEGLDEAIHEAVRRYTYIRDQVRDRFVGILAHDLRNPLNSIAMASVQVMASTDGTTDRIRRLGGVINRSAERMSRMIEDVIEFARGHLGGGIPISLAAGDLGEIAREAFDEMRIGHPDRSFKFETAGDLHGRWDRDRVLQAVSNLLANAVYYGQDPITVSVREHTDQRGITLSVNNRGPAIPTERLAHLFDPLRLDTAQTRRGLGLGLYIVRQIALGHGARCEVRSSEAEGTTFSIIWPRSPEADAEL